jgi:hypothetical protein
MNLGELHTPTQQQILNLNAGRIERANLAFFVSTWNRKCLYVLKKQQKRLLLCPMYEPEGARREGLNAVQARAISPVVATT